MTKASKIARAREIRVQLSRFIDLQKPYMRGFVKEQWGRDPDYAALNRLLNARTTLNRLIAELQEEEKETHNDHRQPPGGRLEVPVVRT